MGLVFVFMLSHNLNWSLMQHSFISYLVIIGLVLVLFGCGLDGKKSRFNSFGVWFLWFQVVASVDPWASN